jgi:hypothetical protein
MVTLKNTSTGALVPATVSYNATTKVVTLQPSSALAASTSYTAKVDGSVRAADGMTMGTAVSWSFTTGTT